ncbi:MAG: MBL fold metallo-hydrolase [Trueperaceae bacterium]|nr:MBL fold metallo-hydrolase [Trueperaceae bacterium]
MRVASAGRVAPGVHVLGLLVANVVAIEGDDGLTLVDAGTAGSVGALRGRLRALGYALEDVRRVLVTHAHPDHVGGLPALVAAGAEVWAPAGDRVWIAEGRAPPRPEPSTLSPLQRLLARVPMAALPVVPVARALEPGAALDEVRPGARTLDLPGHTPGQLGVHLEREGVLIAGDALMHLFPWWHPPVAAFTSDLAAAYRSAEALVALDPRVLVVGHGPPAVARPGRPVARQVAGALQRFPAWSRTSRSHPGAQG